MKRAVLLPGQTIMEMLVVFFIISVALYAAVSLIFSNLAIQEGESDNIVAINLAREMLELAQNARDSNWLVPQDFATGMLGDPSGDCQAVPVWNSTSTSSFFDFNVASIDDPKAVVKLQSTTNILSNQSGSSTQFSRLVTFSPICAQPDDHTQTLISSSCTCSSPYSDTIGVRVRADVKWNRKGKSKALTVYSDLYDWR